MNVAALTSKEGSRSVRQRFPHRKRQEHGLRPNSNVRLKANRVLRREHYDSPRTAGFPARVPGVRLQFGQNTARCGLGDIRDPNSAARSAAGCSKAGRFWWRRSVSAVRFRLKNRAGSGLAACGGTFTSTRATHSARQGRSFKYGSMKLGHCCEISRETLA